MAAAPALKPVHYSALGLGVTALGVIGALIYYRRQQQSRSSDSGGAILPMFQSAALPSFGGGGAGASIPLPAGGPPAVEPDGTVAGPGPTPLFGGGDPFGSPQPARPDYASAISDVLSGMFSSQTSQASIAASANVRNTFAQTETPLIDRILGQLPGLWGGGGYGGTNAVNVTISGGTDQLLSIAGSWSASFNQPPAPTATPKTETVIYAPPPAQPVTVTDPIWSVVGNPPEPAHIFTPGANGYDMSLPYGGRYLAPEAGGGGE